jgi:predicted RNA polymerase sigma factor
VTAQAGARVEDQLRQLAPQVLGTLVRRYGRFDLSEDAVQERCSQPRSSGPSMASPRARAAG